MTNKKYTLKPEESDGFTVGDLLTILKDADPNALIVMGSDSDHCDQYLYQIHVNKSLVGFFSNPEEE